MSYTYKYPMPAVTTDCIIFSKEDHAIKLLLIQRKNNPYKDHWAFPGGFVEIDEDLEDAAKRELKEETGLNKIELKQLYTVGTPGRDPRGRTISVIYYGFANHNKVTIKADSDAKNIKWFDLSNLPFLAFDHNEIIDYAISKIGIL